MSNIKIKGTSVKLTIEIIKEHYSKFYDEWIKNLPAESKEIFSNVILSSNWYDLNASQIEPIKLLAKLAYNNDIYKASYDIGNYGGIKALSGIYKIFIQIPSLDSVVKRVSTMTATYYTNEIKIEVTERTENLLTITLNGFEPNQDIMVANIAGWVDHLMKQISKKPYKIEYSTIPLNQKIEGKIKIHFN